MKLAPTATATLGFPRMGPNRQLKFALEKHWKRGGISQDELLEIAHGIECEAWNLQKAHGVDRITVGDHYLYDGVLQWSDALGILPARFRNVPRNGTERMFSMARGAFGITALSKLASRNRKRLISFIN